MQVRNLEYFVAARPHRLIVDEFSTDDALYGDEGGCLGHISPCELQYADASQQVVMWLPVVARLKEVRAFDAKFE